MDILISSNLERFLFAMTGNDGDKVAYNGTDAFLRTGHAVPDLLLIQILQSSVLRNSSLRH